MERSEEPYEFKLAVSLEQKEGVKVELDGEVKRFDVLTEEKTRSVYDQLRKLVKDAPYSVRDSLISQVGKKESSEHRIMSSRDVETLSNCPRVTVGSHGHVHRPIGEMSREEAERNILKSKKRLTEVVGKPPKHFCYPYGSSSETSRRTVESSFETGVTTRSSPVKPRDWNNPYLLPRVDMSSEKNPV